ncbi:protein phosphatase 2C domain-containing protein [Streptomyces sp. CGMCC 4.7035]|nr:protein phosphatase 2C domain-containing protein [Streptomyces sp. CGMCC 4.7035]WNB98600.1 protein phosphatase 2C domain-containing protein [Streptomyces sp. CGMCC 4.7035]
MSQQGDRPTGREDDWWAQLYDDSTGDTGPAPAADSLDDRFASASGTVGQGTPRDRAEAPLPPETPPSVPEQRGARRNGEAAPRGSGAAPLVGGHEDAVSGADALPGGDAGVSGTDAGTSGADTAVWGRHAAVSGADAGAPDDAPFASPAMGAAPGSASQSPGAPDDAPFALPAMGAAPGDAPQGLSAPDDAPFASPAMDVTPGDAPFASPAMDATPGDAPFASPAMNATPVATPVAHPPTEASPAPLGVPRVPPAVGHVGTGPPTYDAEPTALPLADPDDLDELVADTVLDGARYGVCTLRAVSVRGDSARYRGEPRRDSLLTARFGSGEQGLVLVAMATGARATPGAHRAAAEVCHWIGRAVGRSYLRLGEDIRAARRGDLKSGLHRLTDRSLGKLRASAAEQGIEPEEYAASLRCLLLPADPACRTRVFFGVGAGGLFRLRDGEWRDIEPPAAEATGEPVVGFGSLPSETPEGDRLTMDLGITTPPSPYEPAPEPPRVPFRFRASVAHPGDTLLLCTGGLADPLRGEPQLAEHLTARWSAGGPPGLAAFLADTQVRVKGYADDRTAAAVWEA